MISIKPPVLKDEALKHGMKSTAEIKAFSDGYESAYQDMKERLERVIDATPGISVINKARIASCLMDDYDVYETDFFEYKQTD
ncbi:hypothetical protein [Sulfurovum sp.]|uniref:hypothetical protein n=1 Tax=Sulfurovum sp. TaxID=1969726 RepID=UPI002867D5CB|nr:hypothetical protein [Sulfurovum sp.]